MSDAMEEAIEQLQAKDTKERMAGVERLQTLLEQSRKGLSATEVANLVDASLVLLKDNNFRVSQGTLQALASAAALAGEHLKLHLNSLLPAIVERLGDGKQPVRDAGRRLLLALMEISSPTIIVERAGNFAWAHKNWRVREEFARSVASAINLFAAIELPFQRMLLPSVLQLLEDSNSSVREAAMLCFEEMYRQGGSSFRDELSRRQLRPSLMKSITSRLDKIEPVRGSLDNISCTNNLSSSVQFTAAETRLPALATSASVRRSSPKFKAIASDTSSIGGDSDSADKPVEPIRVHSEKELTKEIEKAAALLTPEQDWSVRIAAMQKIEGLVAGGASEYSCFLSLLKQLVGPLNAQLSDRRSSIVKQACHLLNMVSTELLGDFEVFAESFIPVLFKLVVITVLVIAESADTCIKTMLRNCRVSRVLPKLMECAKHDRNAVLRARCCEYALLVLEQWGDSPEIHRSVDLYEELIKCCVGDAMSEVRASARMCYRVFSKYWPERSRRLFLTFDASVQRLLNEEDGFVQKRYASPYVRNDGSFAQQQQTKQSASLSVAPIPSQAGTHGSLLAYSNSTAMNATRRPSALTGMEGLSTNANNFRKSMDLGSERTLEVLQASHQQVNAIENMLRGVELNEKGAGWAGGHALRAAELGDKGSLSREIQTTLRDPVGGSYRRIHAASVANRVGIDAPSARDPPHPAAEPVANQSSNSTSAVPGGNNAFGYNRTTVNADFLSVDDASNFMAQLINSPNSDKGSRSQVWDPELSRQDSKRDQGSLFTSGIPPKKTDRHGPNSTSWDVGDTMKAPRRVYKTESLDKSFDKVGRDGNGIPGFQRPLLRQSTSGRSSGSSRSSIEENLLVAHFNVGESHNYMEGLMSLNDALTEGLSVSADWSARVAAFTFLRKLLQQGSKGLQEINQSFSLVMKLFSAHLDDPHHKVAKAALATLAEIVPPCKKLFEAYLERILPHVFARLVDAKEVIRQLGTTTLEIVGSTYNIESLLPALLRSLDEQRSPKARIAVIEFATAAFAKLALKCENTGGSGVLKLWLTKLGPLANDKNPKLKEIAVTGIISVYSHFDSTTVLNFILGLSIEEQSQLRRSLKQYTPRIEVDLMSYLQNRSQRVRSKPVYDHADATLATSEGYAGPKGSAYSTLVGSQPSMDSCSSSNNSDGGRKQGIAQPDAAINGNNVHHQSAGSVSSNLETYRNRKTPGRANEHYGLQTSPSTHSGWGREVNHGEEESDRSGVWLNDATSRLMATDNHNFGILPLGDGQVAMSDQRGMSGASLEDRHVKQLQSETSPTYESKSALKSNYQSVSGETESSVPNVLQQLTNWDGGKPSKEKQEALQQFFKMSGANDAAVWSIYFNQIFTILLDSLDDNDSTIRELALSVIFEMHGNQREKLAESTEVLLEKVLHSAHDADVKVKIAADRCLTVVLGEHDPYRCLSIVVPLLVSEDEKLVVTCITSLTKLVSRLPPDELLAQLPSFLPALFDAFGNQNADVRKPVVFCLVDIYIVLGKAFVPYLGSLSSTQLRLVTIYANRISQARNGTPLESAQL